MNDQTQEEKFVCKSCGSKSSGTPGACCGAERNEKKEAGEKGEAGSEHKCSTCGMGHKQDGAQACGCK